MMAIQLERQSAVIGNYTPAQKEYLYSMIQRFRLWAADDNPAKNILENKQYTYTDNKVMEFLDAANKDINMGSPPTNYNIFTMYLYPGGGDMIVRGALIISLINEGLLQLKNQTTYNDSGLSISFFDKTTLYQSWMGMLLQQYLQAKKDFKESVIINSENSGFYGISSDFMWANTQGYYWWTY